MPDAHINAIGTALPPHDVHAAFIAYARTLLPEGRDRTLYDRMAARGGIRTRWSHLAPGRLAAGEIDAAGFYRPGAFPSTAQRMTAYVPNALALAERACADVDVEGITHLVVVSCTGFVAPGLDILLAARLGLPRSVNRTLIGFMGCSAAIPALRLAADTVRADPSARVLVVCVELCSLHFQESGDIEAILSFTLFGDAAAAALVTAEPTGARLRDFRTALLPDSLGSITWHIGDQGFLMHLGGEVPGKIATALRAERAGPADGLLRGEGTQAVDLWAVHAGGRTVLDAVEIGLGLSREALSTSRAVLAGCGNVSSATVLFVLAAMLREGRRGRGLAMAFGPGMAAETARFEMA